MIAGEDLSEADAVALCESLLAAEAADPLIAGVLVALAAKGETEEELAGFASAMRSRSARVVTVHANFIDTCGTGGSPAKTFNVSTAAAFVVAAAGVPVAKHGNVGVTSRAGSADVLRALGVATDLSPARVGAIFDQIGICFMFAPLHHQATRRVGLVRRELGVRTIFNLLGPLTNPAGAPCQLIGVSNGAALDKMAGALRRLGVRRAWVVRGDDGLDELSLATTTTVCEIGGDLPGALRRFTFEPEMCGLSRRQTSHLRGETAEENAATILAVLGNERQDEARDLVLLNAAAALYVAGAADSLPGALALARQAVESGEAAGKLAALREASRAGLE